MMNGYTGFDTLDLIELAVQEDLKTVGMDVQIENQEFAVIFGTWEDGAPMMLGDYDILIYDSGLFAEPGNDIANRYHPDRTEAGQNPFVLDSRPPKRPVPPAGGIVTHRHLLPDEIDLLVDDEVGFGMAPLREHAESCPECRRAVEDARLLGTRAPARPVAVAGGAYRCRPREPGEYAWRPQTALPAAR